MKKKIVLELSSEMSLDSFLDAAEKAYREQSQKLVEIEMSWNVFDNIIAETETFWYDQWLEEETDKCKPMDFSFYDAATAVVERREQLDSIAIDAAKKRISFELMGRFCREYRLTAEEQARLYLVRMMHADEWKDVLVHLTLK